MQVVFRNAGMPYIIKLEVMEMIKKSKSLQAGLLLLLLDVLFFAFFSPETSAWAILPALILIILTIWAFMRVLIGLISRLVPIKSATQRRLTRLLVIALGLIVALQSLGQLTMKDVLTIVPLIALLYLYVVYAGTTSS